MTGKAWAYIGSANCSESAWGKLSREKGSKAPKLNCRNWECGVIVSVQPEQAQANSHDSDSLDVFSGAVPIPIRYPAVENRQPWYYTEQ